MTLNRLLEEDKAELLDNGIRFVKSITKCYGQEKGFELWETIAKTFGDELKHEIFKTIIIGNTEQKTSIIIKGTKIREKMNVVKLIKIFRNANEATLTENKFLIDNIDEGNDTKLVFLTKHKRKLLDDLYNNNIKFY